MNSRQISDRVYNRYVAILQSEFSTNFRRFFFLLEIDQESVRKLSIFIYKYHIFSFIIKKKQMSSPNYFRSRIDKPPLNTDKILLTQENKNDISEFKGLHNDNWKHENLVC